MNQLIDSCRMLMLASALFVLGGCAITPIDMHQSPPSDFPKLKVTPHFVSQEEMLAHCATGAVPNPLACATARFDTMTCDIWYNRDAPPTKEIVEHEELHCAGYDHVGESVFHDQWEKYKHERKIP